MKKTLFFSVLAVFALFVSGEAGAQTRTWLEFFFPSLKKETYDPTETLKAPFADPDLESFAENPDKILSLENFAKDLSIPHILDSHIRGWVVETVSESFVFADKPAEEVFETIKGNYTNHAFQQYQSLLGENGIANIISAGQHKITAFIEDSPQILNKGALEGRYRWIVEVPVILTYLNKKDKDYKDATTKPVNQKIVLHVQVGRYLDVNRLGVLIELIDLQSIETLKS